MTPIRPPSSPRGPADATAASGQAEAFRQGVLLALLAAAIAVAAPLRAQPDAPPVPGPRHERPVGAPQAIGAVHTLRQIPEACTRLEGVFTGEPGQPYRMRAVPTAPNCQPRARYLAAAQAAPSQAGGWILDDLVRVPDAGCPSRQAAVQVWRKPGAAAPERDGQGQTRVYLEEARRQAAAGGAGTPALPQFTAVLELKGGSGCR